MHRIVSSLAAAGLAAFVATGSFAQGGGGGGAGGSGGGGSGSGQSVGSGRTGAGGEMGRGAGETGRGGTEAGQAGAGQQEQTLTVVTVQEDAKQILARPATGGQKTIVVSDTTRIERQGQEGGGMLGAAMDIDDIEPGDRISVMGSTQGDRLNAQRIRVLASGQGEQGQQERTQ